MITQVAEAAGFMASDLGGIEEPQPWWAVLARLMVEREIELPPGGSHGLSKGRAIAEDSVRLRLACRDKDMDSARCVAACKRPSAVGESEGAMRIRFVCALP